MTDGNCLSFFIMVLWMLNLRNKLINTVLILAIGLFSPVVAALLPVTGHLPISKLSLTAFERCFPEDSAFRRHDEIKKRILRANVAMDEGRSALSREDKEIAGERGYFTLLNRIDNWHFYNPNKKQPKKTQQGLIHKSYDRLWLEALEYFINHKKWENKVLFLGALMHLLEDTGVPAHVVPVYHGPTIVEIMGDFEKYTDYMQEKNYVSGKGLTEMIKDEIDLIPPDEARLRAYVNSGFSRECHQIKQSQVMTPQQIRDDLAEVTLAGLNREIAGCKGKRWNIFWDNPVRNEAGEALEDDYFRAYNTDDDFPLFNHHGLIKNTKGEVVCTMGEADARYQEFVYELHKQMIKSDVRLLRWASSQFSQ